MMEVSAWLDEHWKLWLGHLIGQPARMLEVGSYEGTSTVWFMENILTNHKSKMICVDTWKGGEGLIDFTDDELLKKFTKAIEPYGVHRVSYYTGASQEILPCFVDSQPFDAAYIDGSHTAANVLSDSVDVFRLMKPGGIIIWDDYLWEVWNDPLRQPKMAIDAFLACYKGQYEQIAEGWQVVVKKL